ncbi:MAG: helix-turn-helix transcriptional regulator [Candidatus Thorarchaeota archaeon]
MSNKLSLGSMQLSMLPFTQQKAATRVIEFISTNPNSTVKKIAKGTRLSEAAIRYVLIDLLAFDVVAVQSHLDRKQQGRGRPAQHYILKNALMLSTPPRRYWQLSDLLISTLLEQKGEDFMKLLFQSMGEKSAHETVEHWKRNHRVPMSITSFKKALGESLNQLGYNAALKISGSKIIVTTQNCLFSEISRKYKGLLCSFHSTYYPSLLSSMCEKSVQAVERVSCMSHGDDCCQLEIHLR